MVQIEFKLAYVGTAVQYFSLYAMRTPHPCKCVYIHLFHSGHTETFRFCKATDLEERNEERRGY